MMKIVEDGVLTSGELMAEMFTMSERMINNIAEKHRYKKICKYLKEQGAQKRQGINSKYSLFELEEELYLVPNEIFDELDEAWQQELETDENCETDEGSQEKSKVAL